MGSSLSSPDEARKVRGHLQMLQTALPLVTDKEENGGNGGEHNNNYTGLSSIRAILKTPLSQGDLFAAFTAQDAKTLRDKNPLAFRTAIRAAAGVLADDPDDDDDDDNNDEEEHDNTDKTNHSSSEVLNAARILHRTLALVWELPNPTEILTDSEQSRLNGAIARRLFQRDLCRGRYSLIWTPILGEGDEQRGQEDNDAERDCNRIELLRVYLVMASKSMWGITPLVKKPDFAFDFANDALLGALARSMFGVICSHAASASSSSSSILLWRGSTETWASLADACVSTLVAILLNPDSRLWPATAALTHQHTCLILNALLYHLSPALQESNQSMAGFHRETLTLLWLLIDGIRDFRSHSVQNHPELVIDELVPLLLNIVWRNRRGPSNTVSLLQLATFVIMAYSSERDFAVGLNRELAIKNPLGGAVLFGKFANHFDLLVAVVHKTIFDSDKVFDAIHRVLLTILLNVSPYVQELGKDTATKLVQLFERASRPRFLFDTEDNNQHVFFMLEIFNNLIQYGKGQGWLLYALVRSKQVVNDLQGLVVPPPSSSSATTTPAAAKFFPTMEWLSSWKSRLPIDVVQAAITYLEPLLIEFCKDHGNEDEILEFVETQSLVGVVPVPHVISIHRYRKSAKTDTSVQVFFWSTVFLRASDGSESPWDAVDENKIVLFRVKRREE